MPPQVAGQKVEMRRQAPKPIPGLYRRAQCPADGQDPPVHPAGALYPGKKPASLTLGESRKRARTRARGVSFSLITEVVPNRGYDGQNSTPSGSLLKPSIESVEVC